MPKFGLTMQEGTIQQWFKAEGDAIHKGEPLFEVETEKVLYEVEAAANGRVAKLLYPAEATVACATIVAIIALGDEDIATVAAQYVARVSAQPIHAAAHEARQSEPSRVGATAPATPAARKLAKDHGIDLATVTGTGPGGRITREDVEAQIARASAAPLRGMRKSIAERMFKSLQSTAQLSITTEADVTELVARRERFGSEFPLTYTDLLIEAAGKALREHPRLNVTAEDDAVQQHNDIDIGIAVALDEGLIVPVIRNADQKPLREIAVASRALAEKARDGTLGVDEVSGGTFTITNLGMYGVDAFTPILHTPQVAILGVGRIIEKPAVHEGKIVPRSMMMLSLTFDHRIVDGAPAAAFLRTLVNHLRG
jgi:pyruvate dehydrogenase E2 component (dihydrolipoyllysine-residue acetyltransferase)